MKLDYPDRDEGRTIELDWRSKSEAEHKEAGIIGRSLSGSTSKAINSLSLLGVPIMKEQIERIVKALITLPLRDVVRAADMEMFHFGRLVEVATRSGAMEVGEYALHVQCAWRLAGPNGIVVGSRDRYYPAGDPSWEPEGFDWSEPGNNRCDERMGVFLREHATVPVVVQSIVVDDLGSLRFGLSDGFSLEVFPDDSLGGELWRLITRVNGSEHFVVTGHGIED